MVSAPVTRVMTVCNRMIRSKPTTPATTISPAMITSATSLVTVPPAKPSSVSTVDVASTAREASTVSQPSVSSHDKADGSRLPLTPNAARLSTMVGAEPRLPASETMPQSVNDTTMPITPTVTAWAKEMPKSSRKAP